MRRRAAQSDSGGGGGSGLAQCHGAGAGGIGPDAGRSAGHRRQRRTVAVRLDDGGGGELPLYVAVTVRAGTAGDGRRGPPRRSPRGSGGDCWTEGATVSAALEFESVMLAPPAGAAWVRYTVQVLEELAPRLVGLQVSVETSTDAVRLTVALAELLL